MRGLSIGKKSELLGEVFVNFVLIDSDLSCNEKFVCESKMDS